MLDIYVTIPYRLLSDFTAICYNIATTNLRENFYASYQTIPALC